MAKGVELPTCEGLSFAALVRASAGFACDFLLGFVVLLCAIATVYLQTIQCQQYRLLQKNSLVFFEGFCLLLGFQGQASAGSSVC